MNRDGYWVLEILDRPNDANNEPIAHWNNSNLRTGCPEQEISGYESLPCACDDRDGSGSRAGVPQVQTYRKSIMNPKSM